MDTYIARQPILNRHKRLHAYELLFRESMGTKLGEVEGSRATTTLLSGTFLTEGIEKISAGKPCFINFTEELLLKDIAGFFPKNKIVVEVLEDVAPTEAVLAACQKLSQQGYRIALDDFEYRKELEPLVALADIIKIDFRLSSMDEIERILYRLSRFDVNFLAEKVETYEEFEWAFKLGFTYFQGYFFSRPERLRIKEVASVKLNLINLLAEVHQKKTTVSRLEEIISADVAITYKLLRYINSAYFYLLQKVTSVRQAIVYIGGQEIRRFVTLVLISELAVNKPEELIRLSIVRGKFCELLAELKQPPVKASELFLLGLFSLLDALLDIPMEDVVKKLPLAAVVKEALVEHSGEVFTYLELVLAYERGQEELYNKALNELNLSLDDVRRCYFDAVHFSDTLFP